jgi:hypothetical protein
MFLKIRDAFRGEASAFRAQERVAHFTQTGQHFLQGRSIDQGVFNHDFDAEIDAFIAYKHAWPGNEFLYVILSFAAKATAQRSCEYVFV